jgi:hypothetical protein
MSGPSPHSSSPATTHKERVREQVAGSAGGDLAGLTAWAAALTARRDALDIAIGGGHTALALDAHVDRVVAADLTRGMSATAAARSR